jgi:hypothetical protein
MTPRHWIPPLVGALVLVGALAAADPVLPEKPAKEE